MKMDLIRFIGILIIIIVFSLFVYPTPFYYVTTGADTGYKNIFKINRFTGEVYIAQPGGFKKW